jgi:quercetin dioxygenase-like cupin family protein
MRSGYMVLAPSRSVGKHSTRANEEAVIVLTGKAEMRITGGPTLQLRGYSIAYCPPMTEHDVVNTGADTLRYIWLVAKAQP